MPGPLSGRRLRSVGFVALLAAVVVVTTVSQKDSESPPPEVSRAEAEQLLTQAVSLAQADDFDGLCQAISTTRATCLGLLSNAGKPGRNAPQIVSITEFKGLAHSPPTLILKVSGSRGDGQQYISDFAVIRDRTASDRVRSLTPIYWSGVQFDTSSIPCNIGDDGTCSRHVDATEP